MIINYEMILSKDSLAELINKNIEENKQFGNSYQLKLAVELGVSCPTLKKLRNAQEVRMSSVEYKKICDYFL